MSRVRYGGASGQLTMRADSGFYTHAVVSACRKMDVRYSITIRQHKSLRNLIEAIPEDAWTPIPYWMDGAADVAETTYVPFQWDCSSRWRQYEIRNLWRAAFWATEVDPVCQGTVPNSGSSISAIKTALTIPNPPVVYADLCVTPDSRPDHSCRIGFGADDRLRFGGPVVRKRRIHHTVWILA